MDILVDFVGKVLDLTLQPIARQFGYVLFYRRNVDGLKKQVEKLKAAREAVQHSVDAARRNCEDIEGVVQDWMRRVDEIIEEDEKFCQEESRANTGCSCRSCPNLWLRRQISRKAKKMIVEVDQLKGEGNFGKISFQTLPKCIGSSSMAMKEFESRISKMNEIMEALANPAIHMIGLHGLGGVGKTTLSKQVAKKAKEDKLFEMVVWVEVRHKPLREIQSQIAYNLGLQLDMQNDDEIIRANRLCKRLEQEKSLLVLLDDLWERLDFDKVGIPFDDGVNKHWKIILTSRDKDLLTNQMNCKRNIKVELLSENEALRLFKEMSELHDDSDDCQLLSMAAEVAQECAKLPIAVVTVARALRNDKSLTKWRAALLQLKGHISQNIPGVKDEVYSSIRLSYDYLESQELKSLFLLSAMLSQDPAISDVLMYSVGLNFLEGVHNMKEARVRFDALVEKLKASSLFLDSSFKDCFTIHDVVRDVALYIASEEHHAMVKREEKVEWPDEDQLESCTAICLDRSDIHELPDELCGPKVKFFLLNNEDSDLRLPSNFFKGMQKIKVLELTGIVFYSLPLSVSFLKELRMLSLRFCTLKDIIIIKHLKNLRILNLSHSRIKQLPCEVGHLVCLQILNLSHCRVLKVIPPNVLSNLKKLEELYMGGSFNQWEGEGLHEGEERASLVELRHLQELSTLEIEIPSASMLPKDLFVENSLERYKICIGQSWVHFFNGESSRKLRLVLDDNINMEYGTLKLLESVEDLYIENLNGITNLCQFHGTTQSFCKLKAIEVKCCNQLKSLFSITMNEILSRIEEIKISECQSIEDVVAFLDQENIEKGSSMRVIEFPQLCHLELNNLPKLTEFCFSNKVFPKLERLMLGGRQAKLMWNGKLQSYHFPNVNYLCLSGINIEVATFPYDLFHGFPNLERLGVSFCSFQVIFSWSGLEVPVHRDARNVAPPKKLDLCHLYKLKHIWNEKCQLDVVLKNLEALRVSYCFRLISLGTSSVSLENLTDLDVTNCDGLINLLTSLAARTLVKLTRLSITECRKIEEIVVKKEEDVESEIVFVKLESLKLEGLPNCRSFCCHNYTFKFPSLNKVILEKCPRLRIFCLGSLITPSLKSVKVMDDEIHGHINLNEIIRQLFDQKDSLLSAMHLKIDEYPELMDIWNGKVAIPDHSFRNLSKLVVYKCPFLSNHVIPSYILTSLINLEELEVRNCDLVEVVFDLEGINIDKEAPTLQAMPLFKLELMHLPKLKCVWNKDPHIGCFQDLMDMFAYECESLTSIFPASIAKGLTRLNRLRIVSCGVEVIVAEGQIPTPIIHFEFPNLRELELIKLPNLKNFYPQRHTAEWPNLSGMKVRQCNKLKVFSWEVPEKTEEDAEDGIENQYPLLLFEKVVPKFKSLALNQNDFKMISDGQFQDDLFNKIESLYLDGFDDDESLAFPYAFLERFPRLHELPVEHCSFEEIFPCQGACGDPSIKVPQLKYLGLTHLDQLRNIWNEDSKIHPSLQTLMQLEIKHCSKLINLAPSTASFDNLRWLTVFGCHSLRYLLTTITARSLVRLVSLRIEGCKMMEEIVKCESEDLEYVIAFKKLYRVVFVDLPALKSFCTRTYTFEFSSLKIVRIRGCPKMKMFCPGVLNAPELEAMEVEENEERWEGDLNKTLEQLFSEKECPSSLEG